MVNSFADRFADAGARQELQINVATTPWNGGLDEVGFIKQVVSIQKDTTVCQESLETRWTGPTDFPRTDAASHKFISALGTRTTLIPKSAIAWGAVKRGSTIQHLERRREKELLKRKILSIALPWWSAKCKGVVVLPAGFLSSSRELIGVPEGMWSGFHWFHQFDLVALPGIKY